MALRKKNNSLQAFKQLAAGLRSKFSKKQAQIERDVAKQDALRLEDYLYEQGQVNSSALAKRRMQERRGFRELEAEFYAQRQQQASRTKPNSTNSRISPTNTTSPGSSNRQGFNRLSVDPRWQAQRQAYTEQQLQQQLQQPIQQLHNPNLDQSKQTSKKSSLNKARQVLSTLLSVFVRPKQLDLSKQSASKQGLIHNIGNLARAKSKSKVNANTNPKQPFKPGLQARLSGQVPRQQQPHVQGQASLKARSLGTALPKYNLAEVNQRIDASIAKLQKQEKRRRLITVFCFSFSLLLLAIVIGKVILNQTSGKMQLHILKNGDLEQQFPAFGFVAREERVLYSPVAGEIEAIKAEGSLVAADQEIANIVTSDISEIKRKNDSIEQQISEQILTLLKRGKNLQANQLFAKADAAMLPTLNLLRQDLAENKLGHLNNYVYTLQPFLQERNFSLKQMNLADPIIDNLRTEQKVLVHELQEKARIIETPSAGLISYKINPQSIDINTETIQSMSYEQFISYYNAAKPSISTNGKKVKEQVPVIRLVDTRYQYFLLQVANAKSSDFTVNNKYKLLVAGVGQTIENCTVLRVTPDASGVLLLLKCDRNVESLLDQVAIKAKLVKATKSGLIVPKVALVYEDVNRESTAYVQVLKGGFVEKERVRVVDSNEQYAIIEGLNPKDTAIAENTIVVLNPRQVKTGQQVT